MTHVHTTVYIKFQYVGIQSRPNGWTFNAAVTVGDDITGTQS